MTHTPEIQPAFRARVKPLEWENWSRTGCSGRISGTPIYYEVSKTHRGWQTTEGSPTVAYATKEVAQSACQRDHDARVRALLIIEEDHDPNR
jgi:hypothetical protein